MRLKLMTSERITAQFQGTLELALRLLRPNMMISVFTKQRVEPCHPSRVCKGGQKWQFLRSKSGHNGRVIQGPWNQSGNS